MIEHEIRRLTHLLNESPLEPKLIRELHNLYVKFGIDFEDPLKNLEDLSEKILEYVNTSRLDREHSLWSEYQYETLIIPPYYILSFNSKDRYRFASFDIRNLPKKGISKSKILAAFTSYPTLHIQMSGKECDLSNLLDLSEKIKPCYFMAPEVDLINLDILDKIELSNLNYFQVASVEDISKFDTLKLPDYTTDKPYSNPNRLDFVFFTPDVERLNLVALKNPSIGFKYTIYKPIDFERLNKLQAKNIVIENKLGSKSGKPYRDLKKYLETR